jgi:hypothetical protein
MESRAIELKAYFESVELPEQLRLNESEMINNVSKFIKSHLEMVFHNSDKKVFIPYLDRLEEVKTIIEKK